MELALELTVLVAIVAAGSALSRRLGLPAPLLLLVVVGVVASYVPATPEYRLDPDLVLVGILPPLLYAAAIRTSVIDLRRDRRAIALLSVGLVAFTAVTVGFVAFWIVPDLPLAAAFALGAVVAPPDAVAATAVARRVRMPRRLVNILEGESLVNDATAIVAYASRWPRWPARSRSPGSASSSWSPPAAVSSSASSVPGSSSSFGGACRTW